MCAAMFARAIAWHAILAAAPTWRRAKRRDAMQGTFIGVLMSATLPARLGEPSRALIVARRLGRAARDAPRGARHDGLPDAAQPARARHPRRRHALERQRPRRTRQGACCCSRSRRSPRWWPSCSRPCWCRRRPSRARAGRTRCWSGVRGSLLRLRDGLRVFARPRSAAARERLPARRVGAAVAVLLAAR